MSADDSPFPSGQERGGRESGHRTGDDLELRRQLRTHVARYSPPWLRDHVDDITQQAWLRLDEARKKSDRNRNPGTSLIKRVAFCAAMDESRRLRRRREVPMNPAEEARRTAAEEPDRAARANEIRGALRDCLLSMRENRSLAVTLYLQGHTTPETGRLLGWTATKAENLIFRGLADLRRCLAAKGMRP